MKLEDLRPCDLCKSPVAGRARGGNALDFYRVVVEHHLLDMSTIREHAGLSLQLGSERLARVFASRDRGSAAVERRELLICQACVLEGKAGELLTAQGRELHAEEPGA